MVTDNRASRWLVSNMEHFVDTSHLDTSHLGNHMSEITCVQEEILAGRLPVEDRVSRYAIQPWLSNRLKQEKENADPKVL